MKVPKLHTLGAVSALALSGCYSDGYYGQQDGGAYGLSGHNQGGDWYANRQQPGGVPAQQPPADYGSESGDVITLPADGGGYDPGLPAGNGGFGVPSTPAGGGSGQTYTVQKGDNLYRIGRTHGVSMQDIMQLNGLTSSTILPGQQLNIP
ncbi:MAG: hypothetical protein ACI957_002245 [Verrucomicrobiales bacterium]|jgi:hypothetical protein